MYMHQQRMGIQVLYTQMVITGGVHDAFVNLCAAADCLHMLQQVVITIVVAWAVWQP